MLKDGTTSSATATRPCSLSVNRAFKPMLNDSGHT
jgi:hypothetical protein